MTGETILIAGLSGRALSASARRAGFVPLVVDCFGDVDTREATQGACRAMPKAYRYGFKAGSLVKALDGLGQEAPAPPTGVVLGSGFEDAPDIIDALSHSYPILGCDAQTVRALKDPAFFFEQLRLLGIPHPQTQLSLPENAQGDWLSKRIGGSGGGHIRTCQAGSPQDSEKRYVQQFVDGEALSVTGLLTKEGPAFAFTKSWTLPNKRQICRYGGSIGALDIDVELEARLVDTILGLIAHLEGQGLVMRGLVSFDFIVADDTAYLLEINPRPTASLDVLDDAQGTLFTAHVLACTDGAALDHLSNHWRPQTSAAAYLYADQGALTVPQIEWPDWAADRPHTGTIIATGTPAATVIARDPDLDAAQCLCTQRLGLLQDMLYGH